jgi:DNA-binding NtrC family response regulator
MTNVPRVLVLDDMPEDRKAAVRVLQGLADVVPIHDLEGFDAALAAGPVDVLVTEALMSWTTGIDAAARARALWPECACMMLTMSAVERVVIEAKTHRFTDYLLKTRRGYDTLAAAVAQAGDLGRQPGSGTRTAPDDAPGREAAQIAGIAPAAGGVRHGQPLVMPAVKTDATAPATSFPKKAKVLVVEDEPAVRMLVCRELQAAGYGVLVAESAEQAIALCGENEPVADVLLTDIVMPHTDGATLAAALRERQPTLRVVFMSGYADAPTHRLVTRVDGARFIAKPFGPGTLVSTIAGVLK